MQLGMYLYGNLAVIVFEQTHAVPMLISSYLQLTFCSDSYSVLKCVQNLLLMKFLYQ